MSPTQEHLSKLSQQQKKWIQRGYFAEKLLPWYDEHHRALPWRSTNDPYKIWLSEVILQQTRVAQGLEYYNRIVAAFPKVEDLARASEREVLTLWQGLGYYRRALNLHACAQKVVAEYDAQFPTNYGELLKLPGIGPYTAAAIASIAFEEKVAVVDGNVYRVLARILGIDENIELPATKKYFQAIADSLLPTQRIGDYNQAIMEFGATFCTPANPSCDTCLFQNSCLAYQNQQQHLLPVKEKKLRIKHRFFHYFILEQNEYIFLERRSGKDIWKGLYQFYLVEADEQKSFLSIEDPIVNKMKKYAATVHEYPLVYQHQLTHQRLHIVFFHIKMDDDLSACILPDLEKKGMEMILRNIIPDIPFPIILARFIEGALNS